MSLKQAEGWGIKAVLEGRAEGFRQLVASAGGNASEAVVVLVADQLPAMIDSQMKGISNLKIDKVIVWGGGEQGGKRRHLKPAQRSHHRPAARDRTRQSRRKSSCRLSWAASRRRYPRQHRQSPPQVIRKPPAPVAQP